MAKQCQASWRSSAYTVQNINLKECTISFFLTLRTAVNKNATISLFSKASVTLDSDFANLTLVRKMVTRHCFACEVKWLLKSAHDVPQITRRTLLPRNIIFMFLVLISVRC
jgi:hypothetical protein